MNARVARWGFRCLDANRGLWPYHLTRSRTFDYCRQALGNIILRLGYRSQFSPSILSHSPGPDSLQRGIAMWA